VSKPYIELPNTPGITALLAYNPTTGMQISMMAETLLRDPDSSTLPVGIRELIFAYTSGANHCMFCMRSHMAFASEHIGADNVRDIMNHSTYTGVPKKVESLLNLARIVARGGHHVSDDDIVECRNAGCTDKEIHDAVQIAAFACMCNRYVDGLGTIAPPEGDEYYQIAARMIKEKGYMPDASDVLFGELADREEEVIPA
jgi:uncharacterized peroxidase-related enzyme